MSGLDAIIVALAPAFAAGFAIQKLLETCDALFSRLAAKMAEGLNESKLLKSKKIEEATKALDAAKKKLKTEQKPNAENEKTKVEVDKAEKSLLEEEKEFEKSLKVLLTGVAAILIGIWIVSELPISVLKPVMNINATTGAISANSTININQYIDKFITILFIAAGTDGINSILKYLGYAKEQKKSGEDQTTE